MRKIHRNTFSLCRLALSVTVPARPRAPWRANVSRAMVGIGWGSL